MKVIIAGSRSITDYARVEKAVRDSGFTITEIIGGEAAGVDTLGKLYAIRNRIKYVGVPADWAKHGNSAGMVRNSMMAAQADALVAVWDGVSAGTTHMVRTMKTLKKPVFVSASEHPKTPSQNFFF